MFVLLAKKFMMYSSEKFSIYFGDASDELCPKEYLQVTDQTPLALREPYAHVCKQLAAPALTFCHQTHSIEGYVATLTPTVSPAPFLRKGDFLITNQSIAIGVMTADCLPVVIYDHKTHSAAVVHAGWRGLVAGVIEQAIMQMEQAFGSAHGDMQVWFGPAAGACCYEVTAEFKEHCAQYAWRDELFSVRDGTLFFDLTQCAQHLLHEYGLAEQAINRTHNRCTVCDVRYCSYRRDKERAGRQMTVVALRT